MSNFKFVGEKISSKERKKLPGRKCDRCEKYYESLPDGEERMQRVSRHRELHERPKTPDHFWEIDFPDTEECIKRGYTNAVVEKIKLYNPNNRYLKKR